MRYLPLLPLMLVGLAGCIAVHDNPPPSTTTTVTTPPKVTTDDHHVCHPGANDHLRDARAHSHLCHCAPAVSDTQHHGDSHAIVDR